jgi:hypothetical protein
MEVAGKRHASATLTPGKRPGSHFAGAGWAQAALDGCGKSDHDRDSIVGRVAVRYTDWVIAAHK